MSLKAQIEEVLEFEDVVIVETTTTNTTGTELWNYAINKHGILFQFAIPKSETDAGVIEDFLEFIEHEVQSVG